MIGRRQTMLLVAGAALAACGRGGPAFQQPPSAEADAVVELTTTLNFAPERVVVPAGGMVEWRNTSLLTHTVTAARELADDPAHVRLPEGAAPFNSGDLPPGQIYRHTFDVPGEYRYFCQPHEGLGMLGTVVVTPAEA